MEREVKRLKDIDLEEERENELIYYEKYVWMKE